MDSIALRYAVALRNIAREENKVQEFKEALLFFTDLVQERDDFYRLLTSEFITLNKRHELIENILAAFALPSFVAFIQILMERKRLRALNAITKEFTFLANDLLGIEEGIVYSAQLLDHQELLAVTQAISQTRGRPVELKNLLDERLIGGVKVIVRDQVYDGSVQAKIDGLKSHLQRTKAVKL